MTLVQICCESVGQCILKTAGTRRTSGHSNLTYGRIAAAHGTVQSYSPGGANVPPCYTCFLRLIRVHNPNGISIGSVIFAQLTADSPYTLQRAPLSIKDCPFPWGIWTPSNTWFLGPSRVLNPNGISIGSAVLAGLTTMTDRPTDRQITLLSL